MTIQDALVHRTGCAPEERVLVAADASVHGVSATRLWSDREQV